MTPEEAEDLIRRAGRPAQPSQRLARAVLGIPDALSGRPAGRLPASRAFLIAAGALLVAAAAILVVPRIPPRGLHPVSAVELRGSGGATAEAQVGAAEGSNRPVELRVRHLYPGQEEFFELWSFRERPRTLLVSFMTKADGSCEITFSIPKTVDWTDLVITPRGRPDHAVMCTDPARCPAAAG